MRILYAWAKEPPWPQRGVPVTVTLYLPLIELNNKKSMANFIEKVSNTKIKQPKMVLILNPFCIKI